jgi:hypothetical protein
LRHNGIGGIRLDPTPNDDIFAEHTEGGKQEEVKCEGTKQEVMRNI